MIAFEEFLGLATKSDTALRKGLDNQPNPEQTANLQKIYDAVYLPLMYEFNGNIHINSGFRGIALNKAIGGVQSSDHCKGMALDLSGLNDVTTSEIYDYIFDNCEFRQLIKEFGTDASPSWIHVAFNESDNKKQCLKSTKVNGKTVYSVI